MKKILAVAMLVVGIAACGSEAPEETVVTPEEIGQTEQAVSCPVDVTCPPVGSFYFATDTISGVRCYYYNHAPVDLSNQGCPNCCPKYSQCQPNGCSGFFPFQTVWTCRAAGAC